MRFLASRNSLGISTSYSSYAADNNRKKLSANFSHYIGPASFKVKGNKFFFLVVSVGQICDLFMFSSIESHTKQRDLEPVNSDSHHAADHTSTSEKKNPAPCPSECTLEFHRKHLEVHS